MDNDTGAVFNAYGAYYDLFYRDKDYFGEAAYIHGLIQQYSPGAKSIIELGCGTGGHACELAKFGYEIMGLDRSDPMIKRAKERASKLAFGNNMEFVIGDLRDFRSGRHFDIVLALFHVLSYQTSNNDLLAAMATASTHLNPGGVFIFDCWYGPGVLTDPPATRVRRMEGEGVNITRIAEPKEYPNDNRVDVNYEVIVEGGAGIFRIREVHAMRYLFAPEVELFLQSAGLRRVSLLDWLEQEAPNASSWNACFVATR